MPVRLLLCRHRASATFAQVRRTPLNVTVLEATRSVLAATPPANISADDEIDYLARRAQAADELGDLPRRLADLKRISELSRGARNEPLQLYNLGLGEIVYGDVTAGMEALRRVADMLGKGTASPILEANTHSLMAVVLVEMGMHAEAASSIARSRQLLEQLNARPGGFAGFLPSVEMLNAWSDARLNVARGRWQEADTLFRQALAKSEEAARNV